MIDKIDSKLLSQINILKTDNLIDCLIYCDNIDKVVYFLNKKFNIKKFNLFNILNAVGIKTSVNNIIQISKFNNVKYVCSNSKVQTCVNVAKNISGASNVIRGKYNSYSCVVIDTGIFPHIDFMIPKKRIIKFIDLINDKNEPYDDNGHGTFVASLLGGNGLVSGNKYIGVDSKCNIISIKALDKSGESGAFNILKAMQWVLDNKELYNIKLVCMSFGSMVLEKNDPLILAAEILWNNGICVVCAGGNSGPEKSTIKSPAASSKIISVGALNDKRIGEEYSIQNFSVAEFSSRGPIFGNYKPDVVASGVNVTSACNYNIEKKFYDKMSGTSISTPIVAGLCSLIISKRPNITPQEIKSILIKNAIPITGDRNSEGFGWINLKKFFSNV